MKKNKGFTLIELLVVIAIIGILATIVTVSLDSASGKGNNSSIKQTATSMRSQAHIYWVGHDQDYSNFCTTTATNPNTDAMNQKAVDDVRDKAKTTGTYKIGLAQTGDATAGTGDLYCNSGTRFYVISLPLRIPDGTGNFWCVDSKGAAILLTTGLAAGATACN